MGYQSPIFSVDVNVTGVNITTAPQYAHIQVRKGSATALATDTMVIPGEALIFCCAGADTIAAIQDTASGTVNVVPLEWA